jgi:predicted ATP-dependent serine protease
MPEEHPRREELFKRVSEVDPAEWIVEGLAIEEGISILFGDKGVGKTTLSLQLLNAVMSRQNRVLGLKVKPVEAFIIEQDESPGVFRNHRDRVLEKLPSLDGLEVPKVFVMWNERGNDFDYLEELIKQFPARLVIIDSFTSLGIPDINHPRTSIILDTLRRIGNKTDCSFILLHHVNKGKTILGSVTLQIKADSIAELTPKGLEFHKVRGEMPYLPKNTLPIWRSSTDITFHLRMKFRARMLINDRAVSNEQALAILQEEYPNSTPGSIRSTLAQARSEAGTIRDAEDS